MGEVWSVCVGWEDRKMTAQLMKRSGATLISGGGKAEGEESEEKEAWARSQDKKKGSEEEGTNRSLENFCASCSSSAAISDQRCLAFGSKKA
jgi:hypothetical protein